MCLCTSHEKTLRFRTILKDFPHGITLYKVLVKGMYPQHGDKWVSPFFPVDYEQTVVVAEDGRAPRLVDAGDYAYEYGIHVFIDKDEAISSAECIEAIFTRQVKIIKVLCQPEDLIAANHEEACFTKVFPIW